LSEEKEETQKKFFSKFNITLLILLSMLIISFAIGYKVIKDKIIYFLSNPTDLGSAMIIPEGFEADFPFKFAWKSVRVKLQQGTNLYFAGPKIAIDPKLSARRELLNISMDSVYAKIVPEGSATKDTAKIQPLSHPDLWLPFRISVNVGKAKVEIDSVGTWSLDSLAAIKSGRQKRFFIRANDIRGTHLAKNLFLNADYRWGYSFVDASFSLSDKAGDSLAFTLNAPRQHLEDLSAELNASVESLPFWLKDKWPDSAPKIEKIVLHSNAAINIVTGKTDFDLSLKTKIGKLWQLPVFDAAISAQGNNSGISHSEISLKGSNGESVKFKGNVDKNLDGSGELEVKGINITLGPETLPTDVKFHKIAKKGNAVSADFTTGAGSHFIAKLADIKNPVITFTADLAAKEPWAVQWSGDMLKLANPTILTGSFSFNDILLKANLKTKVPYAYYAAADEFEVSLWLNPNGIHFPKGTINRRGYESEFTGEVMWDDQYFTFKLEQPSGGEAEVYGTFSPKIDLTLKNVNTLELPFADTTMLKGYNGLVTANLNHDFNNKNGQASISLSTIIQDFAINAKTDVEIIGDSLIAKTIEIEQGDKRIDGFLLALLPSETRESLEIQKARLNIAEMNLISLLAMVKDSTLSSGVANGNLEFNKEKGLCGDIIFTQIVLAGLDSNVAKFPNLYLEAVGDTVKISNQVSLGPERLWNGTLKAAVSKPKEKGEIPIYVSYTAKNINNEGKLLFNGYFSKGFKSVSGNAQVLGDWFLPSGMGEIKNANINITANTVLGKNALDSLTANFIAEQSVFKNTTGIFEMPFTLKGRVRRGMLLADSILVYGQNDEKIIANLQFDLNDANIKELSFNTKQFTLSLPNDMSVQIKNGYGKTAVDSAIIITAELPSILFSMKSADYGKAEALLKGQAVYKLPFQTGQTQTNSRITGDFKISRAFYEKTLDLVPDPLNLDKTWNSINKYLAPLLREKRGSASEKAALKNRPTDLDIKIETESNMVIVNTNFADFEFGVDLAITGTTRNILLFGSIDAGDGGKVGLGDLATFDLSAFKVYWLSSPIKQGEINLSLSEDYKFCSREKDEICRISIDVSGPLTKLNMQPTANCDIEASPALIYYSMLLGCISEDFESGNSFDRDKVAGKIFGKAMSSTINRLAGGNVVGDIDFKWKLLNDTQQEQDTNYVRIPISLSRWVKNLELVFGFTNTNENSTDPRYDKSYEVGLRYLFDIFDSTDINRNLINPSLEISTNLVARSYFPTETAGDETRLEKNVGLVYKHKFWDPCILGIGYCKMAGD